MKKMFILLLTMFGAIGVSAQTKTDLQKLAETEKLFAKTAEEKGTRTAFLEFLTDDAIIFSPAEANGKLVWKLRPESSALFARNPVWADVSADGKLGYTTGGWELRPKGKTDKPTAFGEYVTIWQKQSDGTFKAVLDTGIEHAASSFTNAAWKSPFDAGTGAKSVKNGVDSNNLTAIFSNKSLANGYFNYLADDCVVLRDGSLPFYGKQTAFIALERLDKFKSPDDFLNFNGNLSKIYGNLMYVWGVYQLTDKDKTVKKWNFVQIWKHRGGKWQIVLDIFNPIQPPKK